LWRGTEAYRLNIKDMEKVECEYCGGLFLVAQAVVLNEKGEFHYFCSKGCAMKKMIKRGGKQKVETEIVLNAQ